MGTWCKAIFWQGRFWARPEGGGGEGGWGRGEPVTGKTVAYLVQGWTRRDQLRVRLICGNTNLGWGGDVGVKVRLVWGGGGGGGGGGESGYGGKLIWRQNHSGRAGWRGGA